MEMVVLISSTYLIVLQLKFHALVILHKISLFILVETMKFSCRLIVLIENNAFITYSMYVV